MLDLKIHIVSVLFLLQFFISGSEVLVHIVFSYCTIIVWVREPYFLKSYGHLLVVGHGDGCLKIVTDWVGILLKSL